MEKISKVGFWKQVGRLCYGSYLASLLEIQQKFFSRHPMEETTLVFQ
jgi:hypothetical protein